MTEYMARAVLSGSFDLHMKSLLFGKYRSWQAICHRVLHCVSGDIAKKSSTEDITGTIHVSFKRL